MRIDRDIVDLLLWLALVVLAVGGLGYLMHQRYELAEPRMAWTLLALPLLVAARLLTMHGRAKAVKLPTLPFLERATGGWRVRLRHLPLALGWLGLGLLLLSLTRPQSRDSWQDVTTEGIDIILALDVSASMLARDFDPDRLEAAKNVGMRFIDGRPNDRIGLVLFEGEAFTQCPLTTDHAVLKDLLRQARSGLMQGGTAIGMGLATSLNRLRESEAKSKVVILLTDGVNNAGSVQPLDAAAIARDMGIRAYTIGCGTRGKALSPVAIYPNGQYKFDMVQVDIDDDMLTEVATLTGGSYYRATNTSQLREVFKEIDELERTRFKVTEHSRRHEEYLPLVLLGGGALLLGFMLDRSLLRTLP
ncbi:MAG: VWA domain-containing protein [Flavobacteriales bacterium]|nr:VWA domain-containing protein [Flavobacteriales bacterium]